MALRDFFSARLWMACSAGAPPAAAPASSKSGTSSPASSSSGTSSSISSISAKGGCNKIRY